jgi:hypothetical protein
MANHRQTTPAADLRELLPASPDAYPQKLDLANGRVLVIRMGAQAYRAASFLDDRVLGPGTQGGWFPGAVVADAARRVQSPRPLNFIFHAGHVGSTLLSRLLDDTGDVLGLREPLPLRTLADAHDALERPESLLSASQFDGLLETMLRLWARGYERTLSAVVKATSSAGRIAGRLLDASPASRAVYLSLRSEAYLATLLGGANSAADLRGHGPGRMQRLLAGRDLPVEPLHEFSAGELAALGWLVENLSRADAVRHAGARVLPLDFDTFIADVAGSVAVVLAHFGLPGDAAWLAALPNSPLLRQYSKAPELSFSPGERIARLAESRRDNREEIGRGLAWLERMARADTAIAATLAQGAA